MSSEERDELKRRIAHNHAEQDTLTARLSVLKVEEQEILVRLADEVERLRDEWNCAAKRQAAQVHAAEG